MAKKILAICAALVAFVALPAMASASPELQTSAGAKVATGTGIKATSSNLKLSSASGNVECSENTMEGKVTENSGTSIKGEIEKATFTGTAGAKCNTTISDGFGGTLKVVVTPEGLPWCLESTGGDNWTLTGNKCGAAQSPISFILHLYSSSGITKLGECTFERADVSGTFNTNASPLVLTVGASQTFTKSSGSFLCPASGTLSGTFNVTTSAGGALKIV